MLPLEFLDAVVLPQLYFNHENRGLDTWASVPSGGAIG